MSVTLTVQIRKLNDVSDGNTALFNVLRTSQAVSLNIEELMVAVNNKVPRSEVVAFSQALDQLNLCNFVAGRRNYPSRLLFYFTPMSIGSVALGFSRKLERISSELTLPIELLDEPFAITETDKGTFYFLPKYATQDDRVKLARFIQHRAVSAR